MIARCAALLMMTAFLLSKLHNFREYWHQYHRKANSANALLESSVCQKAEIRMSIGEFDNCHAAEVFVTISPLHRALHSVAEEMHVCGNSRCAILYMDITDKLSYFVMFAIMVMLLLITKFWRDLQHQRLISHCSQFKLPLLIDSNKKKT